MVKPFHNTLYLANKISHDNLIAITEAVRRKAKREAELRSKRRPRKK